MGANPAGDDSSAVKKVGKWLVDHTLGPVVGAVVLILLGPTALANLTEAFPSCGKPSGLSRLDLTGADITGENAVYVRKTKDSTGTTKTERDSDIWAPYKAFDKNVSTAWALDRTAVVTGKHNRLDLTLSSGTDVQLICAVNGLPSDPNSYYRADRIREMRLTLTCNSKEQKRQVYLQSLSSDAMQLNQELSKECKQMTKLSIEVSASFEGWDVESMAGKVERETKRVALADVSIYTWDQHLTHTQTATKWLEKLPGV